MCVSRILATDKEANFVQNRCLTEQSFLNIITTGCLWNIFFLEVCIHLIANFTCKDIIFERILTTVSDKNGKTRTPSPLIQCWLQFCLLISGLGCLAMLFEAWHNIESRGRVDSG